MKFDIIYADPPWSFVTYSQNNSGMLKSPDMHYKTMKINDICNLNVSDIAEKDSVLIMWVYNPMLPEAIRVIESWGFKFKTVLFNWTKTTKDGNKDAFGMGYYTRQNTEICLLATKGKGLKSVSRSVRQEIRTPKEEHSKKPEETRDRIAQLFGSDKKVVELFARPNFINKYNWILVGNEITKNDITVDIENLKNA